MRAFSSIILLMLDETTTISFTSCLDKQKRLKGLFSACATPDQKYQKIIELGRELPIFPTEYRVAENRVSGCQSTLYLHSSLRSNLIYFAADADALISKGLAALLIFVYSEEPPEVVLKCPPLFLEQLEIHTSLTPNRSNGLSSLFTRMKQEALKTLLTKNLIT